MNFIINFFRTIYYIIYSFFFGNRLKQKYIKQRNKVLRVMFSLCKSDYERLTCQDLCHQINVLNRQIARANVDGCVFTINSMIGLRDKIRDNEKLYIILNNLCIVHAMSLRPLGIQAVFD